MAKRNPLAFLRLEDRCTPSTTGITWPDGQHLTLSFVPDGTAIVAGQSNLFSKLNAVAPAASWQHEIVRAFQTWAAPVNINVGRVSDGGRPLGASGAVQGHDRFGDIRIAALPLPANTLMTNTAFQWSGTTWSGDVIVNSTIDFSVAGTGAGYDLFTAMLNEAGNVFGVLDSRKDPSSAVYYQYSGVHTGLNSADLTDIRSLYGTRSADSFDVARSNGTQATATNLGMALLQPAREADITTTSDVDYYRFTVPLTTPLVSMKIQAVTSGLSGLQSSLQVFNGAGVLVGSATAGAPGSDLSVTLTGLVLGGNYYARIAGATNTVFGIGGYKLGIAYTLLDGSVIGGITNPVGFISNELGLNDLISTATNVLPPIGQKPDSRFDYTTKSTIITGLDVDYYKVTSPSIGTGTQKLNILTWSLEFGKLAPKIEVFSAAGQQLPAQLLSNEDGTFSVAVNGTTPGSVYYVKVSALNPSGAAAIGNYFLGVNFSTEPAVGFQTLIAQDTISQPTMQRSYGFSVRQNQLFQFALFADAGPAGAWTQMKMQILDASGHLVFTLSAYSGMPASSGHVYLQSGAYTLQFTSAARPNTTFVPVNFTLFGRAISDPIGPRTDSGSQTNVGTPTGGSTQTTNGPVNWQQPNYY